MKVKLTVLISAILRVASGFVPSSLKWAVSILSDLLTAHQVKMGATASEDATVSTPDDLRTIISNLLDVVISHLSGRPFLVLVVSALRDFILNNLIDGIFHTLQQMQGGTKLAMTACSPAAYHPAEATKLQSTLGAAVDQYCCPDTGN